MITLFCGLLGLIFGSFFSAAVHRLGEKKKGLLMGRSKCPKCHHTLVWYDLLPVVSFLLLRGKCRYCHKKIAWRYPLYEMVTGIAFAGAGWVLGGDLVALAAGLAFIGVLVFLALYDIAYWEVPDLVSLPAIVLALAYTHSVDALLGLLTCGGFFFALVFVSNGKWMGGGDIRLGALLGAMLGLAGGATALFFGIAFGALYGGVLLLQKGTKKGTALPFVPFLALGGYISLLWGQQMAEWYLGSFWY